MTAYRFVTLTCDGCGEIFDDSDKTIPEARRKAAAVYGWTHGVRRERVDLCGICMGTHERLNGNIYRKEPTP